MNLLNNGLSSLLLETAQSKAIHCLEMHDEDFQVLVAERNKIDAFYLNNIFEQLNDWYIATW